MRKKGGGFKEREKHKKSKTKNVCMVMEVERAGGRGRQGG